MQDLTRLSYIATASSGLMGLFILAGIRVLLGH